MADFVTGAPFQLLYDAVKLAFTNSKNFKSQLRRLEFILRVLQLDMVEQLRVNLLKLGVPAEYLEDIQQKMLEGLDLLNKLSSLSCLNFNVWGSSLRPKYAKQLEDLIRELEILQEMVKMQGVNLVSVFTVATGREVSEVLSNQRGLDSRVADLEKAVFGNEINNPQQVDLPVISILRGALRRAVSGQYQEVPNETNEIQEKKGADELE